MRKQFEAQRVEVLAHLDPGPVQTRAYRKKDYLDDLANWEQMTDDMRRALQPVLFTIIADTGQQATLDLGLEPGQFDTITPNILNYYTDRSTKIAADVNAETEKQLRAAISRGVADGLGLNELQALVEDVMGSASTMRASRIARTETSRAQGYGDIQAWSQSGLVMSKEWFTAEDDRVCVFCSALDGKRTTLGENFFEQGDKWFPEEGSKQNMTFNYDAVPSPPLHPNCRCVLLAVRG